MLSPCLEGDLECGPKARPELAAVCLCEEARRVSRVGGLQRAAQLRCLETELVFPAASCKQPFRRSRRSLKEGFISLGSSRRIFTQWAPERRREQTCFFFFGLPAGEMENIFSRFESFGDKSRYSEPSS